MASRAILAEEVGGSYSSILPLVAFLNGTTGSQSSPSMASVLGCTVEAPMKAVDPKLQAADMQLIVANAKTWLTSKPVVNKQLLGAVIQLVSKASHTDELQKLVLLNTQSSLTKHTLNHWCTLLNNLKTGTKDFPEKCFMPEQVATLIVENAVAEMKKTIESFTESPQKLVGMAHGGTVKLTQLRNQRGKRDAGNQLTQDLVDSDYIVQVEDNFNELAAIVEDDIKAANSSSQKSGNALFNKLQLRTVKFPTAKDFITGAAACILDLFKSEKEPEVITSRLTEWKQLLEDRESRKVVEATAQQALLTAYVESVSDKALASLFKDLDARLAPSVKRSILTFLHERIMSLGNFPKNSEIYYLLQQMAGTFPASSKESEHNVIKFWVDQCKDWSVSKTANPTRVFGEDLIMGSAEEVLNLVGTKIDTDKEIHVGPAVVELLHRNVHNMAKGISEAKKLDANTAQGKMAVFIALRKLYFLSESLGYTLVLDQKLKDTIGQANATKIEQKTIAVNWHASGFVSNGSPVGQLFSSAAAA